MMLMYPMLRWTLSSIDIFAIVTSLHVNRTKQNLRAISKNDAAGKPVSAMLAAFLFILSFKGRIILLAQLKSSFIWPIRCSAVPVIRAEISTCAAVNTSIAEADSFAVVFS